LLYTTDQNRGDNALEHAYQPEIQAAAQPGTLTAVVDMASAGVEGEDNLLIHRADDGILRSEPASPAEPDPPQTDREHVPAAQKLQGVEIFVISECVKGVSKHSLALQALPNITQDFIETGDEKFIIQLWIVDHNSLISLLSSSGLPQSQPVTPFGPCISLPHGHEVEVQTGLSLQDGFTLEPCPDDGRDNRI
jgi:hypothetical protein